MNSEKIWIDIMIPLICALIGGAITFFGVLITIKAQKKQDAKKEILKYKPYFKLSFSGNFKNIYVKEAIKSTLDIENIDYEKTKFYYAYKIDTICITNSPNNECILKEIIIDGQKYKLHETLLFKNETVNLISTNNNYNNSKEHIKEIYLCATDILENKYYYKCEFKPEYESRQYEIENNIGQKIRVIPVQYIITNIGLPMTKLPQKSKKTDFISSINQKKTKNKKQKSKKS